MKNTEFVTQKHFDKTVNELMTYVDGRFTYIEEKLANVVMKVDKLEIAMDRVITTLDWLVGAFKKFDEEHTILTGKYGDIHKKLDNHETRIMYLEDKRRK